MSKIDLIPVGTLATPKIWASVYDSMWNQIDLIRPPATCLVVSHSVPMGMSLGQYVEVLVMGSGMTGYVCSTNLTEVG